MKYVDGEYYHLYNRGSRKQRIGFNQENYLYFIQTAARKSLIHKVMIVAYCLMPNHFHLVALQRKDGSTAKFVQTSLNSYVQAINLQQGFSGTLFQAKTKARHIQTESYLLHLVRYTHLNPVAAGLVKKPEDWEFSDYREWITLCAADQAGQQPIECPNSSSERGILEIRREILRLYLTSGAEYAKFVEAYQRERDANVPQKYLFDEED